MSSDVWSELLVGFEREGSWAKGYANANLHKVSAKGPESWEWHFPSETARGDTLQIHEPADVPQRIQHGSIRHAPSSEITVFSIFTTPRFD